MAQTHESATDEVATERSLDSTAPVHPVSGRGRRTRKAVVAALILVAATGTAYLAYDRFRIGQQAQAVRRSFVERHYDQAREPLARWVAERPASGDAQCFVAWLALVDDRPREAAAAIDRATRLGGDANLLKCVTAVYQARANRINEAEPVLAAAYRGGLEPRAEVAKELARIYLTTYRLAEATPVIDRWRALAPDDPLPYLWSNEIASRSDASPSILIRNYRAALERDPNLDKARLGLADQLSKDRRFDEADVEYRAYLGRNPRDASALIGLGRNAFQDGDLEASRRHFEAALAMDPRQPDALKELALSDLRLGQYRKACERYGILTQIQPYDHEVRYSYSQALKLAGEEARAREEGRLAARLREEHDHVGELRQVVLRDPSDLAARFEVAKWMVEHGHQDEGLKWTDEILRIRPRHAPTHGLLATYYEQKGDPGRANYHRLMAATGQTAETGAEPSPSNP